MGFYQLTKEERILKVASIEKEVVRDLQLQSYQCLLTYCSDEDTYIRKTTYLAFGKIYKNKTLPTPLLLQAIEYLLSQPNPLVRQTAINAAGEIGKYHFELISHYLNKSLFDEHHAVRNAVIGSIKKIGEKQPLPLLEWCEQYLTHPDKEIRREICHGIELRGRTHPQDILPLLARLQFDPTKRVYNTLVHVLGQIAYKKGCLETVLTTILLWENKQLVADAIAEIIDVHDRYKNFSYYTQAEAIAIINRSYPQ